MGRIVGSGTTPPVGRVVSPGETGGARGLNGHFRVDDVVEETFIGDYGRSGSPSGEGNQGRHRTHKYKRVRMQCNLDHKEVMY